MVEKKFYLESSSSPLQEVGMRAQVVSFLIGRGIKEGNALNDSDNINRVIVAISANNEQKIKEIRDELVKHLNKLHKNKFCYSDFPKDIIASDLLGLDNPHPVLVLPLTELSSSLMLEQTSKGVGAMRYLADSIKPLSGAIKSNTETLGSMNGTLTSMNVSIKSNTDTLGAMNGTLTTMNGTLSQFTELPSILKQLKEKLNKA
ncbi:hypothetical protein AUJ17_01955 [Candidatus Micrarchaeota archaeon CG1_02_47_40]|nr:MAG: hypothetical protein AUJ17_01955 [Candidatus Micrarchaeota archaeon CG1_02_47_40]